MKKIIFISMCTFLLTTVNAFAAEKKNGLIDLSKNATYTMSSINGYAPAENIDFLLKDGLRTGSFKDDLAFCTELEDEPFIIIDLKKIVTLKKIEIENRRASDQERAKTLTIWVSKNKNEWKKIWKAPKVEINWIIDTNTPKVQFIKIGLTEKNYLHLNKVRIYGN
jgi:hypothetical protein